MAKHEVVRDKAVELFAAMGFKMADRWDDGELMKKVRKIVDIVPDEGFDPEPGLADVYLGLTEALEAGKDIELVDGPEEDKPDVAEVDEPDVTDKGKEDGADRDDSAAAEPEGSPDASEPAAGPEDPKPSGKQKKAAKAGSRRAEPGPSVEGDVKGVRSLRNRIFCAGIILRKVGLGAGVTEELVQEVDDLFGKRSDLKASRTQLREAWHVLNGYLNGGVEGE